MPPTDTATTSSLAKPIALAPLLLALLVALLVDFSTDTPSFGPFYSLGPASQRTSAWCAAAIVALGLAFLRDWPARVWPLAMHAALRLLPALAALGSFFWTAPLISLRAGARWDAFVGLALCGFGLLLAATFRRVSSLYVVALSVLVGTGLRATHFDKFALDWGADMLPLVTSAVDTLLSGQSPYAVHHVPHPLPLTYYPLTMLAYVPARVFHFDPRWTNVAAELCILAALYFAGTSSRNESVARPNARAQSEAAMLGFCAVYLLPSSIYFDRITTAPIAWAALCWLFVLVSRGARVWAPLGVAGACTPLAVLAVPFAGVRSFRLRGPRKATLELAAAAALTAALVLPWYLWAPEAYIDGTVLWFNDLLRYPGAVWEADHAWERYVGFGGLFWSAGHASWLKPVQAVCVLALSTLYAVNRAATARAPAYAAAAFALFMAFNPVHWPYFYQPVIVLGLVATASWRRLPMTPEAASSGVPPSVTPVPTRTAPAASATSG